MILALSAGRDAPQELRSRLALDEAGQRKLLRSLPEAGEVLELAVLCTCHRTEIYAATSGPTSEALHAAAALLPDLRATDHHDLKFMDGPEAIEHLFRVACGLDSLVIGEPQVLGQVRHAYVLAKEEKTAGRVLSRVVDRAIRL
ncbi:MAG: glutamyl-tRNA reductase, partial [Acidimicrobiia bacterium]